MFQIVLFALVAAVYADAEAEADPSAWYGGLYGGYNGYHGLGGYWGGYGLGAYGLGGYYGLPHGAFGLTGAVKAVEHIPAKVEVKALAPVVAAAPVLAAAPLAAAPVLAAAPALAYGHLAGAPCVNHLGAAVPCALGHPLVNTPAVGHLIAKREAEAEADPAYFYNGYAGYAGYGFAGYGLPHAYGAYRYGGFPYAHAGLYGGYAGAYAGLGLAPSDPTNPQLVHTSRLGVCVNYLGAQVPC